MLPIIGTGGETCCPPTTARAAMILMRLSDAPSFHGDFARAQIANSCNIINLYQVRKMKIYCGSVLGI